MTGLYSGDNDYLNSFLIKLGSSYALAWNRITKLWLAYNVTRTVSINYKLPLTKF